MKKILMSAAAVATAISAPLFADDSVIVYGKINLSVQSVDEANGDNFVEIKSNASRFGLKGSADLGNKLEAFYQLEWEVDVADNSKGSTDNIKSRNQIIGLKGSFGKIFAGRHDTPTKKLQKKIDQFNDYEGDLKHILNGDVRASNILQYSTPKFGPGISANIALLPGEDPASGNDGLADATSFSVTYDNKDLYLGLSLDSDVEGVDVDTTRFATQYKINHFQLGLIYEQTDTAVDDADGFLVSGAYKAGDNTFKLQYADSDIWMLGVSSKNKYTTMTSVGMDHKLGKKTKFFAWYTSGELGASGEDDNFLGFGIEHKF